MAGPPTPDPVNIQGNILAGFSKDFQSFLFVNFPAGGDARGWLTQITPDVATTEEVAAFNALFKRINSRRGDKFGTAIEATWMNVAFTASGLTALGVTDADLVKFDASFRTGMLAQAPTIGDIGPNAPDKWQQPLGSRDIHALVLLASDDQSDLDEAILRHIDILDDHDLRLMFRQEGRARSDLPGHEHFGFKDGVSQPGIRGVTDPNNPNDPNQGQPGQDLLWPGEFVLGYPRQQGPPSPPAPLPGPPDYGSSSAVPAVSTSDVPTDSGPVTFAEPEWAADGSYLVFRRLAQDVAAFEEFVNTTAAGQKESAALVGAKLVGRYKSGCPLEVTKDQPAGFDTQAADPSVTDPSLLDDQKINNFEFGNDVDGAVVPRAAHIRKAYPRNEATPGGGEADTQRHRLLRRGIAYGEPYDVGAVSRSPHAGDARYPHDRGLLFLCYGRSVQDQFELVQDKWVNNHNFPEANDGHDPIIAQRSSPRDLKVPGFTPPELNGIAQFVTTTGGDYFFQPSLSALALLSTGGTAAGVPAAPASQSSAQAPGGP